MSPRHHTSLLLALLGLLCPTSAVHAADKGLYFSVQVHKTEATKTGPNSFNTSYPTLTTYNLLVHKAIKLSTLNTFLQNENLPRDWYFTQSGGSPLIITLPNTDSPTNNDDAKPDTPVATFLQKYIANPTNNASALTIGTPTPTPQLLTQQAALQQASDTSLQQDAGNQYTVFDHHSSGQDTTMTFQQFATQPPNTTTSNNTSNNNTNPQPPPTDQDHYYLVTFQDGTSPLSYQDPQHPPFLIHENTKISTIKAFIKQQKLPNTLAVYKYRQHGASINLTNQDDSNHQPFATLIQSKQDVHIHTHTEARAVALWTLKTQPNSTSTVLHHHSNGQDTTMTFKTFTNLVTTNNTNPPPPPTDQDHYYFVSFQDQGGTFGFHPENPKCLSFVHQNTKISTIKTFLTQQKLTNTLTVLKDINNTVSIDLSNQGDSDQPFASLIQNQQDHIYTKKEALLHATSVLCLQKNGTFTVFDQTPNNQHQSLSFKDFVIQHKDMITPQDFEEKIDQEYFQQLTSNTNPAWLLLIPLLLGIAYLYKDTSSKKTSSDHDQNNKADKKKHKNKDKYYHASRRTHRRRTSTRSARPT